MAKQCNINSGGKVVRLAGGLLLLLSALVVVVLIFLGLMDGAWPWIVLGSLFVFGTFGVYEGWAGWCIVRAMGIKTWI